MTDVYNNEMNLTIIILSKKGIRHTRNPGIENSRRGKPNLKKCSPGARGVRDPDQEGHESTPGRHKRGGWEGVLQRSQTPKHRKPCTAEGHNSLLGATFQ